jgi:hypothetical protein
MRSISMVSEEDGRKLRNFEAARQEKVKAMLIGMTITDVVFEGSGLSGKTIQELVGEKDGKTFEIRVEANQFYEVIESRIMITEKNGDEVENLITMQTPCDTCKKADCKDRSGRGKFVVDCKVKEG